MSGRYLPPKGGSYWSKEKCTYCGKRVVAAKGGVMIWCENYRGWMAEFDNPDEPDDGEECKFVLASG